MLPGLYDPTVGGRRNAAGFRDKGRQIYVRETGKGRREEDESLAEGRIQFDVKMTNSERTVEVSRPEW